MDILSTASAIVLPPITARNISYVCNDKIRNQNTLYLLIYQHFTPPTNLLDYQYFLMNTKGPSRSREGKYPLLRRQARRATPSTLASQHHCQQNDQISLKAWQSPLVGTVFTNIVYVKLKHCLQIHYA